MSAFIGKRGRKQARITRRALVLTAAQLGFVGVLGMRMRQLQIEQSDQFRLLAEENRINMRLIAPERGLILDRNGHPIAENRQNYRIVLIREQAGDPEAVLNDLSQLIPMPPERISEILKEVRQRSAFVPVTVAEHLTWDQFSLVSLNMPGLPGILPEVGLTRFYPKRENFAHLVGYVGPVSESDIASMEDPDPLFQIPRFPIGKTGVESIFEERLRGSAGTSRIEVNSAGRVMRELERNGGDPGADLTLTVDSDLQDFSLKRMAGESASAVLIDVENGDVVAAASGPSFDPNNLVLGISSKEWRALLDNPFRPLSNKPVSGAYPPGSTFKPVVALAALKTGEVRPEDEVYCPGHYDLGDRRFHCWRRGGHGRVNMRKSLSESCDVYYYDVARRVGVDNIAEMATRLGMGERPDLPMPAISAGIVPTKDWKRQRYDQGWLLGDTLNVGIGQGYVLATPLQMATMVARIASGKKVEPRLVRAIDGAPQHREPFADLGVHPEHLKAVRGGMFAVMNDSRGTARGSRIADETMLMAGKTGTSQVRRITAEERAAGVISNEDLPWERRDHALFIAYAPFDAPRYAIAVVVEHGGGGSAAAAPIARDILMRALYGGEPPLAAYPPAERNRIRAERERELEERQRQGAGSEPEERRG